MSDDPTAAEMREALRRLKDYVASRTGDAAVPPCPVCDHGGTSDRPETPTVAERTMP